MNKRIDKAKRNTIIIGVFIVVLMVGSVLALFATPFGERTVKAKYNGFDFVRTQQGWTVWLGSQPMSFAYLPFDLENITLPAAINKDAEKIYLVAEDDEQLNSQYQFTRMKSILYYFTKMRVVDACLQENGCPEEKPIIKCDETSAQAIIFRTGNETKSYKDFQCLVFEFKTGYDEDTNKTISTNTDLEMITEKIIYKILGIVN
ncbi:hypothetical protein HYU06_03640 [Candidatus Woesearchaeota archaeon]|nr:hypothetical protein [Candidatus Woesearchaeota archaeon]